MSHRCIIPCILAILCFHSPQAALGHNMPKYDVRGIVDIPSFISSQSLDDDCSNTNFSGLTLAGLDLSNFNFRDSFFIETNLIGATLTGADFTNANLQGATLEGADLRGAIFRGADLRGASLEGVDWSGADFTGALMDGVRVDSNQPPNPTVDMESLKKPFPLKGMTKNNYLTQDLPRSITSRISRTKR